MFEAIMLFAAFMGGIAFGKVRAVNEDITKQTAYMQDLIDEAYAKRDVMKDLWIEAEEKAETWERRYMALLPDEEDIDD